MDIKRGLAITGIGFLIILGFLIYFERKPIVQTEPLAPLKQCVISGCSKQICSDEEVITTCEYRPEYTCYNNAKCERQSNGECGWTGTAKLNECIEAARR